MPNKAQDDDLVMGLVESTLTQPVEARQVFLKAACKGNPELFAEVWSYVESEQRMDGFLLEPVCVPFLSEQTFQPNEVLDGRFRIVREVAQGGMGVVYEAVDERLGRRIAIKCAKAGFRQQLPPEVRNASEISHPNVCKIFEIHTASTRRGEIDFITMEFLDGETLSQRLKRGLPPEQERQTIAEQLCAGLAEAHRKDVIHGDLKSGNVILTKGTDSAIRAVITDFGLAHRHADIDRDSPSEALGGTPDYMAPELLEGGEASVASDIYALGVILHELACGRRPKTGSAAESRIRAKVPVLTAKWNSIVMRCLHADPTRRFQTVEEVEQALAPRRVGRRLAVAAAAVLLAIATWLVTYTNLATAKESLTLAMLPISSSAPDIPANLSSDVDEQLRRLKGGPRVDLDVIPLKRITDMEIDSPATAGARLGVTQVLRVTMQPGDTGVIMHAFLTDPRSGIEYEWTAEYAPGELSNVPVALVGFVTSRLGLLPLVTSPQVNDAARRNYLAGMENARRISAVDAAVPLLERAVAADPSSALTYAGLAEAEWLEYKVTEKQIWLDRARRSSSKAEARNPDLPQVHRIVGLLKAENGRRELAIPEFKRAIALDPKDSEAHRRLGKVYEDSNQLPEAETEYLDAVAKGPDNLWAYQSLGTFYRHRARFDEAIKAFRQESEKDPDAPQPHRALSTAYHEVGRLEDAETEILAAIHLKDSSDAQHLLGLILMYEGRDEAAIQAYERALDLGPKTALLLWNTGVSYARVGDNNKARAIFAEGVPLAKAELRNNAGDGRTHSELAYLEARLGNSETALEEAQKAKYFSPNDVDTRWNVAVTYEALHERTLTLDLLNESQISMLPGLLSRLKRYPEMADLNKDSRFIKLTGLYPVK